MAANLEVEHGSKYVVVLWDYDAAPDAEESYPVWKRRVFSAQGTAIAHAEYQYEEVACPGVAVFLDGEVVFALGVYDSQTPFRL